MRSLSQDVIFFAAMMNKMAGVAVLFLVGWIVCGCFAPDLLPVASFTQSEKSGISPLLVTFDASKSTSPEGILVSYVWDFGDGAAGQGKIVSHAFQTSEEKTFKITLQVTDYEGQTSSAIHHVTVQAPLPRPEGPSIDFVWPFHYDAEGDDATNLNDEYFTLQNTGDEAADLSGWSVENDHGVAFLFPRGLTLAPGATITIHSGSGVNTAGRLYWNASEPVWNNNDLAVLLNAAGEIVAHYLIVSCKSRP